MLRLGLDHEAGWEQNLQQGTWTSISYFDVFSEGEKLVYLLSCIVFTDWDQKEDKQWI